MTILAATPIIAATADQPASVPSAGSLTDIGGVRVGHFTDTRRPTGCTAILFDNPATAGVDYDGSAPGESLGVMLQPVSPLDHIHGVLLTGGGPSDATMVYTMLVYVMGMMNLRLGEAAAVSTLFLPLLIALVLAVTILLQRKANA